MATTNLSAHFKHGLIQRETICLPDISRDMVLHTGDAGFPEVLQQYFISPENNATEKLIALKTKLRPASTFDFWNIFLEDICQITGSQCSFVSKRILVDDHNTAVEMPPLGERGSCLMGVGFYLAPSAGSPGTTFLDYVYQAYGAPCEYMKHDKVFIVPERMTEFIPHNPNTLPFKSEAYIGVPLFFQEKCFAHFGMIWSDEGAKKKNLGWGFIEMLLHSLEDMVLQRILEGKGFAKEPAAEAQAKIIPFDAITASQSLKPYARSLSHELRTPMQGVVGMLDIMYSTVVGSIAGETHEHVRAVFQDLKEHIEEAQDSSKRAVEAADAVVHAYDLNMQMPETAMPSPNGMIAIDLVKEEMPVIEGAGISLSQKRKRVDHSFHGGPSLKKLARWNEKELCRVYDESSDEDHIASLFGSPNGLSAIRKRTKDIIVSPIGTPSEGHSPRIRELTPSHRHINTREFLQKVLGQSLENGHPERKIHIPSERGETVEVRTRGVRGDVVDKIVSLIIDKEVPETIVTDEAVLQLALHKVIDNAIKFTDAGNISIAVALVKNSPVLEIRITDQGCGITTEAQANLFKPFSQQDPSMSRQKEGLGMGLYIAKARIRQNLGGDMILERSETDGPSKGSQFLVRLPMSASETDDSYFPPLIGTPIANPIQTEAPQRIITNDKYLSPNLPLIGPHPRSAPSTPLPRSPNLVPRSATSLKNKQPTIPYNPHLSKEHPLTFIVAEDNALNRKLLIKCLESLGYSKEDILVAIDGIEAVELYKSSLGTGQRKVDIILMDLWMPNLDGYQATEKILEISKKLDVCADNDENGGNFQDCKQKGREERERVPVIMAVTADITSESQERAKEVGMKGFMSKPYKVIDVQNLIEEHFLRREDIGRGGLDGG